MKNRPFVMAWTVSLVLAAVLTSGCATARARKADPAGDPKSQIASLQNELAARDQQIQELQYELDSYKQNTQYTSASGAPRKTTGASSRIRVSGVTVEDLQRALIRNGYDPGPVDGKMGAKTRRAVTEFQRRRNLKADGIVGEKTWSALSSA